jgi:hypothetical protein
MDEVAEFLAAVEPQRRREEGARLDWLFRAVTGWQPTLWRGGMVGYGAYDYTYDSGHSGTWFATGFAPRKAKLSIYIMPGYAEYDDILARLGKHSRGKSCLYLNKLEDADLDVLAELIAVGVEDLAGYWPVRGT